jgi:integrase
MFRYNYKLLRPDSKTETAIYLLINRYKLKYPIGFSVIPKEWDNKHKKAKYDAALNRELLKIHEALQLIYDNCLNENTEPSAAYLRSELERRLKKKKIEGTQFFNAYEDFKKKAVKYNTLRKYGTIRNHLFDFNPSLKFEDINLSFYDSFTRYLVGIGNHNNSVAKAISVIKAFMRWSYEREYHKNEAFKRFKPKEWEETTDIIYLSEEELKKAAKAVLNKPHLEQEKDAYLLRCLTGLRYSDLKDLKKENIDLTKGVIVKDTIKTGERVLIPLLPLAKEIILKYWDSSDFIPVRSNQKSNKLLKEIFSSEEINLNTKVVKVRHSGGKRDSKVFFKWELITTHTARKTYISLSRKFGLADDVIMKITGITDRNTLKKYKQLEKEQAAEEMVSKWEGRV